MYIINYCHYELCLPLGRSFKNKGTLQEEDTIEVMSLLRTCCCSVHFPILLIHVHDEWMDNEWSTMELTPKCPLHVCLYSSVTYYIIWFELLLFCVFCLFFYRDTNQLSLTMLLTMSTRSRLVCTCNTVQCTMWYSGHDLYIEVVCNLYREVVSV